MNPNIKKDKDATAQKKEAFNEGMMDNTSKLRDEQGNISDEKDRSIMPDPTSSDTNEKDNTDD